ncbi:Arm DNA-binding domain-containing protein [Collimonas pratensis]|uniref:Arm DNA-binding domain-containing protein n=1 Tax=Collimonas pratensis TaxID=279113 RepID=UPI00123766D8|nr:Arm DNA-binding domain-containing protein [Collimonas pratensis]
MPKLATPLTETQIAELKPRPKRYKIGDGHGLYILVEPTGIKRWQMVYKRQGMETSLRLPHHNPRSRRGDLCSLIQTQFGR